MPAIMRGSTHLGVARLPAMDSLIKRSFEYSRKMEESRVANFDLSSQRAFITNPSNSMNGNTVHAIYAHVNYNYNPLTTELPSRSNEQPNLLRSAQSTITSEFHQTPALTYPRPEDIKPFQLAPDWPQEAHIQPTYIQFQHPNADAQEHQFYQHAHYTPYETYQAQAQLGDTFQGQPDYNNNNNSQQPPLQNSQLRYFQGHQGGQYPHCVQGQYYGEQPTESGKQCNGARQEQNFQPDFALAFGAQSCVANQEAAPVGQTAAPVSSTSLAGFEPNRNNFDRGAGGRPGDQAAAAPAELPFGRVDDSAGRCAGSLATPLLDGPAGGAERWASTGEGECESTSGAHVGLLVDRFGAPAGGRQEDARAAPHSARIAQCTAHRPGRPSGPSAHTEREPLFASTNSAPSTTSQPKASSSTKRVRRSKASCRRAGAKGRLVSSIDGIVSRRKNATRETTAMLKDWLDEHGNNPYPTKGEKIMLALLTKLTLTQVSTWFANARRRLKNENKGHDWSNFAICRSAIDPAASFANVGQATTSLTSSSAFLQLMKGEPLEFSAARKLSSRSSTCARERADTDDGQPSSSTGLNKEAPFKMEAH